MNMPPDSEDEAAGPEQTQHGVDVCPQSWVGLWMTAATVAEYGQAGTMPSELPLVFTREVASRCGYSTGQIKHRLMTGEWTRIRRGVYAESRRLTGDIAGAHSPQFLAELAALASAVAAAGQPVWLAGRSARRLHGLPEAHQPGDKVTLACQVGGNHHTTHTGMTITPSTVPPHHRAKVHGIPTLSAPRTVVDALRLEQLPEALMIGDRALRMAAITRGRSGATREELNGVLDDCRGWPGIVQARERAALLDGRRETPLESGSVAMFIECGLPIPQPQYEVWFDGQFLGRSDFAWIAQRTLGEADGKTKYVDDLPNAGPLDERIWRERLRQDGLQQAGWEVVRWTDYERRHYPERVQQRILAAFARAQRLGFTHP